jgi:beta-phosphoglucomutase
LSLAAIVLDFDGVIADTEPLHLRAFREVLSAIGIELNEEDYYARYLGYDDQTAFRMVAQDAGRPLGAAEIAELLSQKAGLYERALRATDVLYVGADEAIFRLAGSAPLAIASGALRSEIELVLDRAGLLRSFAAIVAAGEAPGGKPAPDQYLRAAHLLNVAAPACVAVEDSPHGLQAARDAGMKTVAVTTTCPASALGAADLILPGLAAVRFEALSRLIES